MKPTTKATIGVAVIVAFFAAVIALGPNGYMLMFGAMLWFAVLLAFGGKKP